MMGSQGSVTDRECQILAELARGKNVLEIGTCTAVSTLALNQTAASLTTVDIDPWVHENVFPALRERGIRCCEDVVPGPYDMVFIDGCHKGPAVVADYHRIVPLVKRGALITFHDMQLPGVAAAIRELDLNVYRLGTALGLGFMVYAG
jgi:predicted O-methyltransferase YrrM